MAIQLSDRDMQIFKFIEEHEVLLEKHIAWLISYDEKPVLIRDRLRKLFYLDYVLCQRHDGKLPWWTTPTKPLVYALSPMTRQLLNSDDAAEEHDAIRQKHLLEIANLRMIFLMEQKDKKIANFKWTTLKDKHDRNQIAAQVSFERDGQKFDIGIMNHPDSANALNSADAAAKFSHLSHIWIVASDEAHKQSLQQALSNSLVKSKLVFVTHHEIYKSGLVNAAWQNADKAQTMMFAMVA